MIAHDTAEKSSRMSRTTFASGRRVSQQRDDVGVSGELAGPSVRLTRALRQKRKRVHRHAQTNSSNSDQLSALASSWCPGFC